MRDVDQPLTQPNHTSRSTPVVPSSEKDTGRRITPREVERRHPRLLPRRVLTRTRSLGLPPPHVVVSGCILYDEDEIERFLASPAAVRCSIYGRADSLQDPSSTIVREIEACDEYVGRTGWTRIHTCVEFGPPSGRRALRHGLQDLLNEALAGEYEVLLVYNLSHISPKVIDQRRFIRQFKTASVQVVEVAARTRAS